MANRSYAGPKTATPDAVKRLIGNRRGERTFGPAGIGSPPRPTATPQVIQMGKSGTSLPGVPNAKRITRPTGARLTSPKSNTAMKPARRKMVHSARPKNAALKNAAARRLSKFGRSKFARRF